MSEKTTFVGPARAAQKRARARAVPAVAPRAAQVRAETARAYASIRHAADLTQVALAQQMGVPQTVVSRRNRQHDMLLSTLSYLRAAGERRRVNRHDVELDLATLVD